MKSFGLMLLSVVCLATTTFLYKDSEIWYNISLGFLVFSFILFILARVFEMQYVDVKIITIGSFILSLLNILL